jgi:hypothetical protein
MSTSFFIVLNAVAFVATSIVYTSWAMLGDPTTRPCAGNGFYRAENGMLVSSESERAEKLHIAILASIFYPFGICVGLGIVLVTLYLRAVRRIGTAIAHRIVRAKAKRIEERSTYR